MGKPDKLVVVFREVDKEDVALVGGKGANLGEMIRNGFPVPDGFIVTANAYYEFLKENDLAVKIKHLLKAADFTSTDSLSQVSNHVKKYILGGTISEELKREVFAHYKKLGGVLKDALVAVRSSATAEDLPTASFAGQQETFLNVRGEANLIQKIKAAWASLFEPRAIFYRHEKNFDHFKVGIAVPVQKMVESQTSGVMFTLDPVTNDKSKIVIEAIYGLGELIVQGKVTPDHYEVSKKTFEILVKQVSEQSILLEKSGAVNKEKKVAKQFAKKQKISDKQIIELAKLGLTLEKHYYFPQDAEWAIEKAKVYIVQTRPVTTLRQSSGQAKNKRRLIRALEIVLTTGKPVPPLQKNIITTIPWYNSDYVFIGVKRTPQELKKRIRKRISVMFKQGLLREVKKLRSSGLSWNRIEELGFEYRFIASYLQKGLTLAALTRVRPLQKELKARIQKATEDFARRQMSWFKKDKRIHWIGNSKEAQHYLRSFLKIS